MRIEINAGAVITAAILGVCAWAVYKQAKAENAKQKKFKEIKTTVFESRNLDEEVDKATIANGALTVASRVKAKEVLKEDLREVENASTIEKFKDALAEFENDIRRFTTGNDEEVEANVLYQHNLLQVKNERKQAMEARAAREAELSKFMNTVTSVRPTVSATFNDDTIKLLSRCLYTTVYKAIKREGVK